jgi:hypothetical protein
MVDHEVTERRSACHDVCCLQEPGIEWLVPFNNNLKRGTRQLASGHAHEYTLISRDHLFYSLKA